MATVEELVRSIVGSVPTGAGGPVVAKWIDERYKEMVSRVRFRHLRKIGELSLPAVYDTGTAAVDRGSTVVTGYDDADGDGTAWATTPTVLPYEFWYMRLRNAWYNISTVTDDDTLGLASAFAEVSVEQDATTLLGGAYKIVKRFHPLASDARWLGDFVHTRTRVKLDIETPESLDIIAPGRMHVGGYPWKVAQLGVDKTNSYLMVEVYPPPTLSEIIHYVYWSLPSALTISSTIPPVIDDRVLKEGALIDTYRFAKVDAVNKGNIDAAGLYGNWESRQRTIWEKAIIDAKRSDRGVDDTTMILQIHKGASSGSRDRDVKTARGDIIAGWTGLG